MFLETIINNYCNENGLIYGIVNGESLVVDNRLLENQLLDNTPFVNYSLEERLNPKKTFDEVQSSIFLGVPLFKQQNNKYITD